MILNYLYKLQAIILTYLYPITKKPRTLILDAEKIARLSNYELAIKYVSKHNYDCYKHSILLLKANRDINNEQIWLHHINSYLSSTNTQPITLSQSIEPRFFRIRCEPNKIVNLDPLVSVVMTSHNSEKTIFHAINSILNQTWANLELFVIDDLSTDSTWKIINELAAKDLRIKPLRNKHNVGTYVSKNIGLLKSRGKYITCHDSDDWAHPCRIEKQVLRMIKDKAKASIILKIRATESMEITRFRKLKDSCIDGITHFSLPSVMFEADFFNEKLGSWDCVRFSADKEIYERTEIALKDKIKKYHIFGQICLEADYSLTNHPLFGLKNSSHSQSPRKKYRDAYREWHKSLTSDQTYLPFPHAPRLFASPEIASVEYAAIKKVVNEYDCQL